VSTLRPPRWRLLIATTAILYLVDNAHWILTQFAAYRALHHQHPFYWAESIDKLTGALLCVGTVWLLRRNGAVKVAGELGLASPLIPAIWFALFCSTPMLIGFAITRRFSPSEPLLPMVFLTLFSPIVEEIEYRGFGVRQLQRGTGWPFWMVVWPSALLFGWGHVEQGQNWKEMAGIFLLVGTGGVVFAWLLARWQNLWFPIMLHIAMNLWWELFSVARTAIGGWLPFVLQTLTVVLAIAVTLRCTSEK